MEHLYRTVIPRGIVHSLAWSGINLIAVSVSVEVENNFIAENYERAKVHQLLVFDPDRPWDFHCVVADSKSVVSQVEWSQDGRRFLALDRSGVIHIWRMKSQCMNEWVCAHKQPGSENTVVHAAWLEHRPMMTINHTKKEWSEVMEYQPFCPHIQMLVGNAFTCIYSNGKVCVTSVSIAEKDYTAEAQLEADLTITAAKTLVIPNGSVLCAVGCEGGCVKVYTLSVILCQAGGGFTVTATPATEVHPTGSSTDSITSLLMVPHADGCVLHVCYDGSQLYQWSVKDMTRSGSYQAKRERVYTSPQRVEALATSAICLGSCDPTHENDIIMLDEESDSRSEGVWPVEVMVLVEERGDVVVLNRDSYKHLLTYHPPEETEEISHPASKRPRVDPASSRGSHVTHLSPTACCVAIGSRDSVQLYHLGGTVLGLKDSTVPGVPRCSRMLSLAMVTGQLPWDLAVICSRLENKQVSGFIENVLSHFSKDFTAHSSTLKNHILSHYFSVCSLLHSCHEDGLLGALTYRNLSRLHGTTSLLNLCLPTTKEKKEIWLLETLQDVCLSNSSEESLESIADKLEIKDFVIPPDTASQLQGHVHWITEFTIRVISEIAMGKSATVSDSNALELLRQSLLLVFVWNKALRLPILSVTDSALSLLFKALTVCTQSLSTPLPEELQSEISSNIPTEKYPNQLTLTRAAHLQGFLSGLASCSHLPETYQRSMSPRIRPHVQKNYISKDPYSPLSLLVPQGLSPPWQDCFVEGQRDIIHGGTIMKTVVMNARLKQCSRCRCWTVASENLQSGEGDIARPSHTASPVQQWRNAWSANCLCGGLWTLKTSKRT